MATPDASDRAPGRVLDTDGGWHELATRTARYLLDLDARRLKRTPRHGPVDGTNDTATVVVRHFELDRDGSTSSRWSTASLASGCGRRQS